MTNHRNQSTPIPKLPKFSTKIQKPPNPTITNFAPKKISPISDKENVHPDRKDDNESINYQFKRPEIQEKVFLEDFKEIASEEVEMFEDNNDLICDEKIQDIRFKGKPEPFPKEKKQLMTNITEETDEDMSNNCSPNKNEVINALINKKKCSFESSHFKYIIFFFFQGDVVGVSKNLSYSNEKNKSEAKESGNYGIYYFKVLIFKSNQQINQKKSILKSMKILWKLIEPQKKRT